MPKEMLMHKGLRETVIDSSFGYFYRCAYFEQVGSNAADLPFLGLFKRSFFEVVLLDQEQLISKAADQQPEEIRPESMVG